MQRITLAIALAAASLTGAKAETVFVGNAFVDFASSTPASCPATFSTSDFFRVIYRPRGAAMGNGADSHLAVMASRAGFVMQVRNNDFRPSVNYVGQAVSSQAVIGANSGGITVWEQTPGVGSVGAGTPTIKIRGRFANFFRITGCFVELRGNLVRR